MVWGTNVEWGASDIHLAPTAELGSGTWQLLYIQRASKCALIDAFLNKLGAGRAKDCSFLTEVTCSEFELDPQVRPGPAPHTALWQRTPFALALALDLSRSDSLSPSDSRSLHLHL